MFYSYIVLPIYVNETVYLLGNLPFCKIHVNHFMAWDDSPGTNVISKCMLWVRGLVTVSEFLDISFLLLAAGSYITLSCIGEGNGNPLWCSCLENPGDRGAWWAAICGVAQSWTQLK